MKIWADFEKRIITQKTANWIREHSCNQDTLRLVETKDGSRSYDFHETFAGEISWFCRVDGEKNVGVWTLVTVETETDESRDKKALAQYWKFIAKEEADMEKALILVRAGTHLRCNREWLALPAGARALNMTRSESS